MKKVEDVMSGELLARVGVGRRASLRAMVAESVGSLCNQELAVYVGKTKGRD